MQILITFNRLGDLVLPIQYNHILQGFVYNLISPELADYLHNKGYPYEKRIFKLFSFSRISGKFELKKNERKIIFPEQFRVIITSPLKGFCEELCNSLLLRDLELSNQKILIEKVELIKSEIKNNKINVRTCSPMVAYSTFNKPEGGKYTNYYNPKEKEFQKQLDLNLKKKYITLYNKKPTDETVSIKTVGKIKENIIKYKGFIIKGYSCNRMILEGNEELLEIALSCGVLSKNSMGFGCITTNQK